MSSLDKYIIMASGTSDSDGMTKTVELLAKKMGIGRSTVFRWRRMGRIDSASDMMKVAILINKNNPDKKVSMRDLVVMSGIGDEK